MKEYSKSVDTGFGAMFEMDSNTDESNLSSSCSDEDFSNTKKKEVRIHYFLRCLKFGLM